MPTNWGEYMKSCPVTFVSLLFVLILSEGRALSQSEKEATTAQVLQGVPRRSVKRPTVLHFEAELGGKTLGFSIASLIPAGKDGTGGSHYRVESALVLPNGQRIDGEATARLNDAFAPTEVQFRREVTLPDGKRQSTVDRAEVRDNEISLTREVDTDPPTNRSVPRPESPFVLAVEFLVQRVDLKRFPAFAVREFDFQEGNIIVQHFKVGSELKGSRWLVSREDDGSIGYAFEIDAKGEVVSWAEPPLPVVFKRCSRERSEELRKSMQGR